MCAHGRIRGHAAGLAEALRGFENMAAKVADRMPALAEYDRFAAILDLFAGAGCTGCRAGGSQLPFCAARVCFREKGVDFCFQCDEYPCERNTFPDNLASRQREYNDRTRSGASGTASVASRQAPALVSTRGRLSGGRGGCRASGRPLPE